MPSSQNSIIQRIRDLIRRNRQRDPQDTTTPSVSERPTLLHLREVITRLHDLDREDLAMLVTRSTVSQALGQAFPSGLHRIAYRSHGETDTSVEVGVDCSYRERRYPSALLTMYDDGAVRLTGGEVDSVFLENTEEVYELTEQTVFDIISIDGPFPMIGRVTTDSLLLVKALEPKAPSQRETRPWATARGRFPVSLILLNPYASTFFPLVTASRPPAGSVIAADGASCTLMSKRLMRNPA